MAQPGDKLIKHDNGAQFERVVESRTGTVRGWSRKPLRVEVLRIQLLDIFRMMNDLPVRPAWVVYAYEIGEVAEKLVYAKKVRSRRRGLEIARAIVPFERAA